MVSLENEALAYIFADRRIRMIPGRLSVEWDVWTDTIHGLEGDGGMHARDGSGAPVTRPDPQPPSGAHADLARALAAPRTVATGMPMLSDRDRL